MVAEFVARAGYYQPQFFTVDAAGSVSPTEDSGFAFRSIFARRLTLKGEVPLGSMTLLNYSSSSRELPSYLEGRYYLFALNLPYSPNRLLGMGSSDVFFQAESADQWKVANLREVPTIPAGDYSNLGDSPHKRYAGVLVQAYERDPKPVYLQQIESSIPRYSDNITIPPDYVEFYINTLKPRLIAAAGDNIERKARILKTEALITKEPGYQKFWEFFDHFDATHDPEETVWIEIPIRNSGDIPRLFEIIRSARTSAARAAAIRSCPITDENKDIFIGQLSDPNRQVRVAALIKLDQIQLNPQYRVKRAGRDAIANEEELIRFWRGG